MKKLFLVCSILLIWLVAADLGLRILWPGSTPFAHVDMLSYSAPMADPLLIGALEPSADLWMPAFGADDSIRVQTNAYGFRDGLIPKEKPADTTRVVIMGSSAAFGWGLPDDETLSTRLETILYEKGNRSVEVINAAVPESTLFLMLKAYERHVHRLQADWLILVVGHDDTDHARLSDEDVYAVLESHSVEDKPDGLSAFLAYHSFLGGQWMSRSRETARETLATLIEQNRASSVWKPRVETDRAVAYGKAILDHHAQQGGKAILVHANLLNLRFIDSMRTLAESTGVPLLDLRPILERNAGRFERQMAFDKGLEASTFEEAEGQSTLRFRVLAPPVHSSPLYISGNHESLGTGLPNRVLMRDDGREGDEKGGDGVWTLQISLQFDEPIRYSFTSDSGITFTDVGGMYKRERYNSLVEYEIRPREWAPHVRWTSIVHRLDEPPYADSFLPGPVRIPDAQALHTLATRLAAMILAES